MGALGSRVIALMLQLLAGVGVAEVLDKVLPDKVPNYQPLSPLGDNKSPVKAFKVVAVLVAVAAVVMYIGKKMKIRILTK